jgi:glycosyltransferase involved in cell wall biosynthesis
MPILSIITVNLNNVNGLKATMDSILDQTFTDFEFIVIDGDSNDGSYDLIKNNINKIGYWVSEKDNGVYDAMNKGIIQAKGEFLLFLNSGDRLWQKDTLEGVINELDTDTDILYGNLKIDNHGSYSDGFMPQKIDLPHMMRDTLWHPVSFIRKSLFDKFGLYDTAYKICGDYDFFFKVLINAKVTARHINRFISIFDLGGMSSDIKNHPLITAEKQKIQKTYLTQSEIEAFRKSQNKTSALNFLRRWFQ